MKRIRRISPIVIIAFVGVLIVGFIFLFGQESLTSVGSRFMTALAKGDVGTLTKMSYLGDSTSADQIEKEWQFACGTAAKHYTFIWRITSSMEQSDKIGSVQMQVTRNAANPGAYEEGFQLPMLKVDGQWKVDVRGISREMYPALPR